MFFHDAVIFFSLLNLVCTLSNTLVHRLKFGSEFQKYFNCNSRNQFCYILIGKLMNILYNSFYEIRKFHFAVFCPSGNFDEDLSSTNYYTFSTSILDLNFCDFRYISLVAFGMYDDSYLQLLHFVLEHFVTVRLVSVSF